MRSLAGLVPLLVLGTGAAKPEAPPSRLLISTLGAEHGWVPLAKDLSEAIVARVAEPAKQKGVTVLSEADVALMATYVREAADLSDQACRNAEACLTRISQAAEAHQILTGRIDRLGDSFVGVLSLLDAARAERIATRSCIAGTEGEFRTALVEMAAGMLGYPAAAAEPSPPVRLPRYGQKVAVVPLTGLPDRPGVADTLTDLLGLEVLKYEYSVLTRKELLLLLHDARERRALQPSDETFDQTIIALAGATGADYLATGHVARFDASTVIILKLIQISEARVVRRVAEAYRGPADYLPSALKHATQRLFGREPSGVGGLSIVTEARGEYRLDRGAAQALPQGAPDVGLAASKHELSISAEGYLPYSADVYVDPGPQAVRFRPALEELPAQWYETPLFWGIVGVAVAGAATAILLATVPPDSSGGDFSENREF